MRQGAPFWLDPGDDSHAFPDPALALEEPNGLLALGGDLTPRRLLNAYRLGIFPWYSAGQPILWWTPDPRAVLFPERLHVSRSLRKALRRGTLTATLDTAFDAVVAACAEPRPDQDGTWITEEMRAAYGELHRLGHAHSAEAWHEGRLVGGLYGVAIGRVFFGESMFTRHTDASKVAFVRLVRQLEAWRFGLVDCQMYSGHLARFGAEEIPRARFMALLDDYCERPGPARWTLDPLLATEEG
ncbi:MAG TPA: leucyl/phenylalanyl-tRNA--protein transferase [Gammaproteobacteria bacterium]|nr:leucyl/phenylalanyl-tRNA--protein transferase [Gammaproteobacteria bacterium]